MIRSRYALNRLFFMMETGEISLWCIIKCDSDTAWKSMALCGAMSGLLLLQGNTRMEESNMKNSKHLKMFLKYQWTDEKHTQMSIRLQNLLHITGLETLPLLPGLIRTDFYISKATIISQHMPAGLFRVVGYLNSSSLW